MTSVPKSSPFAVAICSAVRHDPSRPLAGVRRYGNQVTRPATAPSSGVDARARVSTAPGPSTAPARAVTALGSAPALGGPARMLPLITDGAVRTASGSFDRRRAAPGVDAPPGERFA